MNKKVTSILSYCTIIGWLVAFIGGDKENAKFDLNQGLVLGLIEVTAAVMGAIFGILPFAMVRYILQIPFWAVEMCAVVGMVFGIIASAKGEERELPIVSQIKLIK